ncbi:hypothetical protein C8R45DRAFT_1038552 [Mycena sanguinolenta]|nr:hypothetical protein C8R45DRAFT_1038552 [Mycena sanguinolenta]
MDGAELPPIEVAAFQNILLYDHLLTLDDEVEYIWTAPRTLAKTLFMILRYMVPVFLTAETITRSGLAVIPMSNLVSWQFRHSAFSLSFRSCRAWNGFALYAGWLTMVISNFLVLLRIWTTLPRNHCLIAWSLAFFIVMQLMSFAVTTWVISTALHTFAFDSTFGLCVFSSKQKVFALWAPGLLFELTVFLTVCWNMLQRPRTFRLDTDARMARLLFRDGVTYFLVFLRIANTVVAIVAPVSAVLVVVFFIWAATTVTTSRLIINSRREVGKAERLRAMENDAFRERRMLRSMSLSSCG